MLRRLGMGVALLRLGWCARAGGCLALVVGLVQLRGLLGIRLKFGPTTLFCCFELFICLRNDNVCFFSIISAQNIYLALVRNCATNQKMDDY